jgi:hypothetical protein
MSFATSQIGFIGGEAVIWHDPPPPTKGIYGAGFAITTNGGASWQNKYCSIQDGFQLIFAADTKHIYAVGSHIYYSSDAGNSWAQQSGGGGGEFYFFNAGRGYSVVGDEIWFTSDTGKTWIKQNSTVTTDLHGIYFVDTLTGWASGDKGVILHTINAGQSWVRQYLPFDSIIVQTYPEPAMTSKISFHYTIPSPQNVNITLYDATGKTIQSVLHNEFQMYGEHTVSAYVSKLPTGNYLYEFRGEKYTTSGVITIITP